MSFNIRNDTLHALVESPVELNTFLETFCDSPPFLLDIGAVYLNKKRVHQSLQIQPGDYVRAHLKPKRFAHEHVDWVGIVKFECPQFLIVDKPAGLPVHSTLDNLQENLVALLSKARGEKLFGTHRLDQPTQGLVCVARTPQAASLFHRWLRKRQVVKKYRVWTTTAVPTGTHVHFMKPTPFGAKEVFDDEAEGLQRCELEVVSSRPLKEGFESEVILKTGRTHQIRAQFRQLNAPLVGDLLYGGREHAYLGLQSFHLSFPVPVNYQCELDQSPWSVGASDDGTTRT